ncbi:MAG TPA: AraC family transcriptional regulator [Myxococcales bacterium]|nr:AraC family transcriptional regulator [Myxococcales bacterium]
MSSGPQIDRQLSPQLRFQWYDLERLPPGKSAHQTVEVTWVTSGQTRYRVGSETLAVPAGQAILVRAGVEHVTEAGAGFESGSIKLEAGAFEELCDAFGSGRQPSHGLVRDPQRLVALGNLVRRELASPMGDRAGAEALCESVMIETVRRRALQSFSGERDPRIRAALDRIESLYAQPLSVADLAKAAGMSRFHFSRLFREQVGRSPYQQLLATRVARAEELLHRGGISVTEVAFDVGFQDLGRFSRAFRAHTGRLPSAMRHRGCRNGTIRMTNRTIRGDRDSPTG